MPTSLFSDVSFMPSVDPVHQLVAVGHGATADTVFVNGQRVLQRGHATKVDEATIFRNARRSVAGILKWLDLPPSCDWPRRESA